MNDIFTEIQNASDAAALRHLVNEGNRARPSGKIRRALLRAARERKNSFDP